MTPHRWRLLLWGFMGLVVLAIAWEARRALLPFVVGATIAYAVSPLVDRLAALVPARTHRADVWRRGIAVLVVYSVFFGSMVGAGFALVPTAADQVDQFVNELPQIVEEARTQANDWFSTYRQDVPDSLRDRFDEFTARAGETAADTAAAAITRSVGLLTGTITFLFGFLILPFWMFYAIRDRHFVERNFLRAVPPALQDDVRNLARVGDHLLGRYIRGQLFLGLVVGTAVGLALTLMNVELSLGLGLWAGITELIPIIGPWLGAAPGLVIVAATDPGLFIWVGLVYLVVQQLENNLLVPRIQGQAVDVHPAMVILLLAVAGAVWGILGMVVVIPLAAILRELFWYADRRLRGETPTEAFAHSHVGSQQVDLPFDERVDAIPEAMQGPSEPIVDADGRPAVSRAISGADD